MFSLLDCLFSEEIHTCIQQNKECNHHIEGQKYFFFEKSLTFSEVQMGRLRACPMHLRLMPTTSLLHNLHNEETRDNTFDYIFHSNWKKLLPTFSDYLIWNYHVHLCIVINHAFSLYHWRKHKPTFHIINNWWLKYYIFLVSSKYS